MTRRQSQRDQSRQSPPLCRVVARWGRSLQEPPRRHGVTIFMQGDAKEDAEQLGDGVGDGQRPEMETAQGHERDDQAEGPMDVESNSEKSPELQATT